MKFYADRPLRRTAQTVADLGALLLVVFAIRVGVDVHTEVMKLQAPGNALINAGRGLSGTFDSAADHAGDLPLIGRALAGALHGGADAGTQLSNAGQWQVEATANLALWMAVILIGVPVVFLLVTWLPLRVHFIRRATAGVRLRRLGVDGHDLLALRALATQPLPRLAAAGEVTTGWRERDPGVISKLAGWELERLGLNP
jgi:hypothetical protein